MKQATRAHLNGAHDATGGDDGGVAAAAEAGRDAGGVPRFAEHGVDILHGDACTGA